jgi:hypothetical protein
MTHLSVGANGFRAERSSGLISEHYDPADFVRAAVAWDRLRLEAEVERELEAAELTCERAWLEKKPTPHSCPTYVNFLRRVRDWLRSGAVSRQMRRDTRAHMFTIAEALVSRGQLERSAMSGLHPPRPRRRNR